MTYLIYTFDIYLYILNIYSLFVTWFLFASSMFCAVYLLLCYVLFFSQALRSCSFMSVIMCYINHACIIIIIYYVIKTIIIQTKLLMGRVECTFFSIQDNVSPNLGKYSSSVELHSNIPRHKSRSTTQTVGSYTDTFTLWRRVCVHTWRHAFALTARGCFVGVCLEIGRGLVIQPRENIIFHWAQLIH